MKLLLTQAPVSPSIYKLLIVAAEPVPLSQAHRSLKHRQSRSKSALLAIPLSPYLEVILNC